PTSHQYFFFSKVIQKGLNIMNIINCDIAFRGKCISTGEWVYGVPVSNSRKTCIVRLNDSDELTSIQVIPETVGRFTELYDKKGNGICVGDIVFYRNIYSNMFLQVKWINYFGMFIAENVKMPKSILLSNINHKVEIMGNIHDNPEWLENV
ncbi:MAG: YopX family protein, partial [Ruminococcus sp.]|nr:YopX family protein [Ruminococcus sp.]